MNTEEKILEILEKHGQLLEKLTGTVEKQGEAVEKLNARMENLDTRMENLGTRMVNLESRMENLESKQAQMQDDLTSVKLRLELDVEKRFDAVNEGIDAIMKKLDTLDEVKELAERTADRVDVIEAAVTQHSTAITELKKA